MNDRGQTPSDYIIGMSLVLVTIIGVFGAIQGGIYEPFEDPVGGDERTMADELGTTLIEEYQTTQGVRTVDNETMTSDLGTDFPTVRSNAGIPEWKNTNVTLQNDTKVLFTAGDVWRGDPAATSTRVVRSNSGGCASSCELVIRVWS